MASPEPRTLRWRRSTFSSVNGQTDCVEVALAPGTVAMRDSKDAQGSVLGMTGHAWHSLLANLDY